MTSSSNFSGTAAVSSGTLADMINRCQVFLNDESDTTWDTEMIGTFLNDAIRDYSQHFPRIRMYTINLVEGIQKYDLPGDFLAALSVEYPTGETPPAYLTRMTYSRAGFWDIDGFYDIIHSADYTNTDKIKISAVPFSTETAVIYYHAYHNLIPDPATPIGNNSVPMQHQHLLVLHVQWKASVHLANAEQQNPTSNSSLLMAQLAQNARRNELSFHTAMEQSLYAAEGESQTMYWTRAGSGVERIY